MIYPMIVAAGVGRRFGAATPKQYLTVAGKTILEHSAACLVHPAFATLTLVVARTDSYIEELLPRLTALHSTIYRAVGGDERWQSVLSGIEEICRQGGQDDDWVLIHDAARPCLPRADLNKLLGHLQTTQASAVILATAVVDTLKYATSGQISHTVSRENLWQALTPQAFRIGALKRAFAHASQQNLSITDEATVCEALGIPVQIIPASRSNIKLTHADDLPLIERLIVDLD